MFHIEKCEGDARSTIFAVAAKLFAEKGYDAVSMREIAEQSGLSKPTIYYYFGSKEGIYSSLLVTGIEQFIQWLDQAASLDIPVTEKLRQVARTYFKAAREFPDYTRLFLNMSLSGPKLEFNKKIEELMSSRKELGAELFQEGIEKGELKANLDPDIAAKIYSGTLVHYVLHYLAGDENIIINDELANRIVDVLIEGMID